MAKSKVNPLVAPEEPTEEETVAETVPEGKLLYELRMPFWDGKVRHKSGSQLYFAEGAAPKGSVVVPSGS